jgi:hypothetical protein
VGRLAPGDIRSSYELLAVKAALLKAKDFSGAGNNLVEPVPMPSGVVEVVRQFVTQHYVDRPFVKRERDGDTRSLR